MAIVLSVMILELNAYSVLLSQVLYCIKALVLIVVLREHMRTLIRFVKIAKYLDAWIVQVLMYVYNVLMAPQIRVQLAFVTNQVCILNKIPGYVQELALSDVINVQIARHARFVLLD